MNIVTFEAENVKRLRAARFSPRPEGVTSIGGRNAQGKSSILDTIMALVKGGGALPSDAIREGATEGHAAIELDNGTRVEMALKTGKDGGTRRTIRVEGGPIDGTPQSVLDAMFGKSALDISRILRGSDADRRQIIAGSLGVADELEAIAAEIKTAYDERAVANRVAERAQAALDDAIRRDGTDPNAIRPDDLYTMQELQDRLQQLRAQEADIHAHEVERAEIVADIRHNEARVQEIATRIRDIQAQLQRAKDEYEAAVKDLAKSRMVAAGGDDQTVGATADDIAREITQTEAAIRAKQQGQRIRDMATARDQAQAEADAAARRLTKARAHRAKILGRVSMGLDGLVLDDDLNIVYMGRHWDCISGSERIRVAAAIQARITPECRILLCDGLESLDAQSVAELNTWAEAAGIQIIGTRVTSERDGVEIYIEDGETVD